MKTVYVGLSGGVDSSVTAALLQQQGYHVVGVHMQNWTLDVAGTVCPWRRDLLDAKAVAAKLDIPFKVFDFQTQYRQSVVDIMVQQYQAGLTPNPDVLCNQEIKFKLFLDTALAAGADLIATGHYARITAGKLLAGRDAAKDQSYFLYRLPTAALSHTLLPLGGLTKPQVRQLANRFGLPTATKPDSQGICFVGQVGIKEFLQQYLPPRTGPVVSWQDGRVIGSHDGAYFYTIGQRHGLNLGAGGPYFVVGKDMATNTVWVTADAADLALAAERFFISDCHWLSQPRAATKYQVRTRYRADLVPATLQPAAGGYVVKLTRPERAVSPGQSAVVYAGDQVVGGGIISVDLPKLPASRQKRLVNLPS